MLNIFKCFLPDATQINLSINQSINLSMAKKAKSKAAPAKKLRPA